MRLFLCFLFLVISSNATVRRTASNGRRMTASYRRTLTRTMRMDMEERRARLIGLSESEACKKMIETNGTEVDEKLKEIGPITQNYVAPANVDIFHLNEAEGASEYFFQGDMHFTDEQLSIIEKDMAANNEQPTRAKRQASTIFRKWTDNTLFYFFDVSVSQRVKDSVTAALSEMQAKTCINFVESPTAPNRVKVFSGPGCFATVGMNRGEQQLSLGRGCEVVGTAAHEFAHALGIFHTQMRSDRDDFVSINVRAIDPRLISNFDKLSPRNSISFTPYEYGSMMHYPANAFANPGEIAIISKDIRFTQTMGSSIISFFDIKTINDHYECSAQCAPATSARCANGGVPNPRNCRICNCPSGYAGALCNQRPSGCGETLTATANWVNKTFSFGDNNNRARDVFTFCNHWVTAPAGRRIQVKVVDQFNNQCFFGCPFNGMEIKVNQNQQETNPRICCDTSLNQVFTSRVNPTPIVSFNRFFMNTYTIQFRHISAVAAQTEEGPDPSENVAPPVTRRRRGRVTRGVRG